MALYADLQPCNYFGDEFAGVLTAVGWLEQRAKFSQGNTEKAVFNRLVTLMIDPWQPMTFGGVHECTICQFARPTGYNNLFVPNGERIFVSPELITHYIACHRYQPPEEFVAAVMNCPDIKTMAYKQLLLDSGGRPLVKSRR